MKVTKRLIKAICALVASVVLCVGVCLAWFANNDDVEASGLNNGIRSINITKFEVEAFNLTDRQTQTIEGQSVTSYKVGATAGNNKVEMAEYGGLVGNSTTALLLKFTYSFENTLDKNYAIYADCKNARGAIGHNMDENGEVIGGGILRLNCALSSVVGFYGIGETSVSASSTVTQKAEMEEEEVSGTFGNLITLKDAISDSVKSGVFYCIIDYVENKIYTQYYKALTIEGTTFSTPMDFIEDIEFYIQESRSL